MTGFKLFEKCKQAPEKVENHKWKTWFGERIEPEIECCEHCGLVRIGSADLGYSSFGYQAWHPKAWLYFAPTAIEQRDI